MERAATRTHAESTIPTIGARRTRRGRPGRRRSALRRGEAAGRASRRPLPAALGAPPRPHRVARAGAGGCDRGLGRARGARTARSWRSRIGEPRDRCVRNPRDLLLCASHTVLGRRAAGVRVGAQRPPHRRRGVRDLPRRRATPHRARARRPSVARMAGRASGRATLVWGPGLFAARMDALVALGRPRPVEIEAPTLLEDASILEPFALRALGATRGDDDLLAKADERSATLGLEWHRSQTERLLAGI